MGRYYIEASGQDAAIAAVAEEHYSPLGPSDDVPGAPLSVTVALADKIDMLTGFWAIDEKPTGSKDPFALRRAALGVIRLILSNDLRLPLDRFIDRQLLRHKIHLNGDADEHDLAALHDILDEIGDHGVFGAAFLTVLDRVQGKDQPEPVLLRSIGDLVPDLSTDLLVFIHDRLKGYLRDEGIRHDIIDACRSMPGSDDLNLLVKRARALAQALGTENGANLVQGFKRANNILTQAEEKDGVEYSYGADVKYAETDSEKALFAALEAGEPRIEAALKAEDFTSAVAEMADLRPAVDAFFEDVKINADSEVIRRNRLNLLAQIRKTCGQVADLTSSRT